MPLTVGGADERTPVTVAAGPATCAVVGHAWREAERAEATLTLTRARARTLTKSREIRGARVGARLDCASRPRSRRAGDHHHAVSHLSLELLPRPHAARHLQLVHGRLSSGGPGVLLRTEQG